MKSLCRALIWNACFLELSGDDILNPDSAVKALEDMAFALQEGTDVEKAAFIEACRDEAAKLASSPEYSKTAEFIASLPVSVGIIVE
jgi:hypothetical protein